MFRRHLEDQSDTEEFGGQLAAACKGGLLMFLQGQLGAGKTTLVRGFLRELGHSGSVKSPTYTLVEPYALGERNVYHLDLYRLGNAEELEWIGVRDLFEDETICLVEWPEQGEGFLPQPDLRVHLRVEGSGREIRVEAVSPRGGQLLRNLASTG